METRADRNQLLLVASGLAAIALVGWVMWHSAWPPALVALAFAAVFVVSAYDEALRIPATAGPWLIALLLGLNVLALLLYPYQVTLILSVVLAASAPYHLSPRASWLLLVVANGFFFAVLWLRNALGGEVPGLLSLVVLQGFAASSSLARRGEALAREALAVRNEELQSARAALARQSQAEERLRIAGALHDTIGHRLTALQLQLEVLSHEAPEALCEQLRTCRNLAADLLEDVRAIVRRMPGADSTDLPAALRELEASTPGVTLAVTSALPSVSAQLSQQLAYCFQEAVHNAVRHGRADRIEISHGDGAYRVDDNGRGLGATPPAPGFGINNIRQRLRTFGGDASLQRSPALRGCRLILRVPDEDAA